VRRRHPAQGFPQQTFYLIVVEFPAILEDRLDSRQKQR